MEPGENVTTVQKLGHIERLIAALWVVGTEEREALDKEIERLLTVLSSV